MGHGGRGGLTRSYNGGQSVGRRVEGGDIAAGVFRAATMPLAQSLIWSKAGASVHELFQSSSERSNRGC